MRFTLFDSEYTFDETMKVSRIYHLRDNLVNAMRMILSVEPYQDDRRNIESDDNYVS